VLQDEAYSPAAVAPRPINQFMVVGPGDRIDGNAYPWAGRNLILTMSTGCSPR